RLSNLGRREDALTAATEAVDLYRRLAATNPAAFEPDLARSLWCYAWVCEAGDIDLTNALDAGREAVSTYERLVEQWPDVFQAEMSAARATMTKLLDRLGH
ncbi:hypothetical protein, partial [Virgisporangium ochraceum]|uniref:hypothetical protein n=1 Tax=Virgisporangium ochraceum TaxID=65505 RepID=UPI00194403D5